jgi:hypothetical protein
MKPSAGVNARRSVRVEIGLEWRNKFRGLTLQQNGPMAPWVGNLNVCHSGNAVFARIQFSDASKAPLLSVGRCLEHVVALEQDDLSLFNRSIFLCSS